MGSFRGGAGVLLEVDFHVDQAGLQVGLGVGEGLVVGGVADEFDEGFVEHLGFEGADFDVEMVVAKGLKRGEHLLVLFGVEGFHVWFSRYVGMAQL